MLLSSCGGCKHIDENHDHFCDLCNAKLSECLDENHDHLCDVCEKRLSECKDENFDAACDYCGKDMPVPEWAAKWPTEEVQDLVEEVANSNVVLPPYKYADEIEINTDELVLKGYFSVWCYTENDKSELEYKGILTRAGWEIEPEKDQEGFYWAYDPNYEVCVNFGFFEEFSDLEICVTKCTKTKWPADEIATYVNELTPGTKTVIPKFEAYTYQVNYYSDIPALAINAVGFKDSIIEDYKRILMNNGWNVSFNELSDEWNAFSKYNDIELHFYLDAEIFNVDVLHYEPPVENWPYEEIQEVIDYFGATGEVLPFKGEATGFKFDWSTHYYPSVFIYCDSDKQVSNRDAYNQMLLDAGYEEVGELNDEPFYGYPGTTLAYRATIVLKVLQVEMCFYTE